MSQDPRVGSGGEQEWVSLRRRFSRSTNQVTLLFTLHPSLLPSFCRRKGTFPGNESEGKKLHSNAIHSVNDFSSSKKTPNFLYIIFEHRFPNIVVVMPLAHLTRHNLLENSTERGNPMNRKPVKAAQREKENTCSSPPVFSTSDLH